MAKPSIALIVACVVSAGCRMEPPPEPSSGFVEETVVLRHVVGFPDEGAELTALEERRLRDFLAQAPITDAVAVVLETDAGPLGVVRATRVTDAASRAGRPVTGSVLDEAGSVAVAIRYAVVAPAACAGAGADAGALLPFGCANALNLARSVADPADLSRPRPVGPPQAGPVGRVAARDLAGETPDLPRAASSFEDAD